jgi:HJR/Mrr/RecB family endonuclease
LFADGYIKRSLRSILVNFLFTPPFISVLLLLTGLAGARALLRILYDRLKGQPRSRSADRTRLRKRSVLRLQGFTLQFTLLGLVLIGLRLYPVLAGKSTQESDFPGSFELALIGTIALLWILQATSIWLRRWRDRRRWSTIQALEQIGELTPDEFEAFVAVLFREMGYQAQVSGQSGDHGVDIVLRSPEGSREIVQCKRWAQKNIGEPIVRDFYGTLSADEEAELGYLITTSSFTQAAIEWAENKPIELINGDALVEMIEEMRR